MVNNVVNKIHERTLRPIDNGFDIRFNGLSKITMKSLFVISEISGISGQN